MSEHGLPAPLLLGSQDGFSQRVGSSLRGGQVVEVILDGDPSNSVRCGALWLGKPGSKQEGEAGQFDLRGVLAHRVPSLAFFRFATISRCAGDLLSPHTVPSVLVTNSTSTWA